ncbi:hypothetical protein PtA15_3A298 [Puccinia triticina]|uniref:Carbohydrate-binding module family 19 domain-containing protein n=1 Tax=Puccinia triticina TaxID=208348 RepID=A0ABY7CEY2_9BASI|nr:uncharacterized protein PtA15_3A298 [Puccinia triticina]WAQ82933.1 hypothetical protein PtA15_3A298 [Puccinia triticina]WAR53756.1 hypothetical protein PtB15_3B265 [Puccinia triticina]
MPSSFFASIVLLVLIPCAHSHAVDPSVVPTTLLHHERRAIDQSTLLENGKAAQKLNAQFSSMNPNSPCKTGDMACIAGGFSQCVSGKYVGGPCAGGLKCFAMPLLLKKGTTLGCDTEDDATSRISNTGATGGLTGNGGSDPKSAPPSNSTAASPAPISKVVNGTQADSSDSDPDEDGPDATMADNASSAPSKDPMSADSPSPAANSTAASASKSESDSEKQDDSVTSGDDMPAGQNSTTNAANSSSSSNSPAKPSSADKPKQVAEVVDLDEQNITGP